MTVKMTDIPALLVERIESAHPAPALFSATETDDWPAGSLGNLQACGILRYAQRAEVVVCPGCSWQCHKPVVVRSGGTRTGGQAFIVCDEEPDYSRQPVSRRGLDQYSATVYGLSACLAGETGWRPPGSSRHGTSLFGDCQRSARVPGHFRKLARRAPLSARGPTARGPYFCALLDRHPIVG
jgi:hypothetical protein